MCASQARIIITDRKLCCCRAGQAGRMLRDALTDPARRDERRPPLLSDRGERQGLRRVLRHPHRQRYAFVMHACHHPSTHDRRRGLVVDRDRGGRRCLALSLPLRLIHSPLVANSRAASLTLALSLSYFRHVGRLGNARRLPRLRNVKAEPVSMATVIAVVIACLFLIIVVTLCLLYAYRSERCCFNRESRSFRSVPPPYFLSIPNISNRHERERETLVFGCFILELFCLPAFRTRWIHANNNSSIHFQRSCALYIKYIYIFTVYTAYT